MSDELAGLTEAVIESFAGASSPRFRVVMESLVRHLHAFVGEVTLTSAEWATAIDFLTRTGHMSDGNRQEFVLLSDVLGVSMATVTANEPRAGEANEPAAAQATESTVLGPFFVEGSPAVALGADISAGASGQPCYVYGTVRDTTGKVIPDARLEVWESDEDGFYDVQYDGGRVANRGHQFTDEKGNYRFWAVRPAPYPIPYDGPVGELLTAAGRGPMRPAHIHFMVSAPGYHTVTTHIFVDGGEHLHEDAVFGVKSSLIKEFVEETSTNGPDGREMTGLWSWVRFDIVLAPAA